MNILDDDLFAYIRSDLAGPCLTLALQQNPRRLVKCELYAREDMVFACSYEAIRIAKLLGLFAKSDFADGEHIKADDVLLSIKGEYSPMQRAVKLIQVLLEYSCSLASYSKNMLKNIQEKNPKCVLLATRKSFPFAKSFCVKSVLAGGAMMHRLGLHDSVLFFKSHRLIYENDEEFYSKIPSFKAALPEKKIVVESESLKDAKALLAHGLEVLQCDKFKAKDLLKLVDFKNQNYPTAKILAAGGIDIKNAASYAATGVDAIISSAMFDKSSMKSISTRMYK